MKETIDFIPDMIPEIDPKSPEERAFSIGFFHGIRKLKITTEEEENDLTLSIKKSKDIYEKNPTLSKKYREGYARGLLYRENNENKD